MPDVSQFDLDFRPKSYWGPQDLHTYYDSRIKGEIRRRSANPDIDSGEANPELLSESLPDALREARGAIHPWFMGGEYLPDLYPNEVEIARVTLKSTTMDVISIRARKTKHRIVYRIVDEYPEYGFDYTKIRKTSIKPLTLRQLITFMDNAQEGGLVGGAREFNYREVGEPEELYDFETASSAFYPELSKWYDDANEEWLDKELGSTREERDREQLESEYLDRFLEGEADESEDEKHWRSQNCEFLTDRLHNLYRSRYLAQEPAESENEITWRNENAENLHSELEFAKAVVACLESADWYKVGGAMAGWGNSIRRDKIRAYIENYLRAHGRVPTGEHIADGVKVTFSSAD